MDVILLFDPIPDFSTWKFVTEEWQASSIAIAVTYLVFIMGVPALIFQIFIPESFRSLYNVRMGKKWKYDYYWKQFLPIIILFILSNQIFLLLLPTWLIATMTFCIVVFILLKGFQHLATDFDSMRNLEYHLSKKIADDAIDYFNVHQNLNKKDLEDLSLLAKEFPAGRPKNIFLKECERIIEHLLNVAKKDKDLRLVGDILKEAVCQSITYDGAQSNQENMDKALALLNLAYGQAHAGNKREALKSYLYTDIVTCMKEIGIRAMHKGNWDCVMNVVDDLSAIEGTSKMMYALGSEALRNQYIQISVTVVKRLSSKIQQVALFEDGIEYNHKMIFFCWLGLVSKIFSLGGAAEEFAQRQINVVAKHFDGKQKDSLRPLFEESRKYFYQQADFTAIDAIKNLEKSLFSNNWPTSIVK